MIAAGNLFTSCIQQLEPTGIQEMREAKAEYYESLAGLKNADAAKVLAEAEVERAKAAVVNAKAAQEQAKATILELKAEAAAMYNEQKAAEVAAAIDSIEAAAALAAVEAEEALAKAEAQLAKTLDDLAVQAEQLTPTEQWAVSAYVTAYEAYLAAQDLVYYKEKALWEATNAYGSGEKAGKTVEETLADYEAEIAEAEADIALYEARIEEYEAMSDAEKVNYGVWKAEYDSYVDSIEAMKYESAEIAKAKAYYNTLNADAFGKFTSALELAQDVVDASVSDARAGFKMEYTVANGNAFPLPEQKFMANGVVDAFRGYVKDITPKYIVTTSRDRRYVEVVSRGDNAQNKAKKAIFGEEDSPEDLSLEGIIDALERDSVVVDQFVKDTAGIGYLVDSLTKQYIAVKETLVKGIADYKPYKDSLEKEAAANKAYEDAKGDFKKDTGALLTSINNFVAVWNKHTNEKLDYNDSTEIWNALIALMSAREKALDYNPAKDARDWRYYEYYEYETSLGTFKPVKKSVKFTELKFSGIQCVKVGSEYRALYAGTSSDGVNMEWPEESNRNAMAFILTQAFGDVNYPANYWDGRNSSHSDNPPTIIPDAISVDELYSRTTAYSTLFFGIYHYNKDFKQIRLGSGEEYTSQAVKDAKKAYENATEGVVKAKSNYYKNIYCKFWGLDPAQVLNADKIALKDGHDSLRINFTEKTYTEPTVVAVFQGSGTFFNPATGNAKASIDWSRISLMENAELDIINDQIHQNGTNGLKPDRKIRSKECPWTLYAQALAASEFQELAKNYKENTEALALLRLLVTAVELAYVIDSENVAEAKAMADSLVTAYLGEDMVEVIYALENKPKDATPCDIWNDPDVKDKYVVNPETVKPGTFYTNFCVGDKFFLGGLQLAAAEQFIPDFAETIYGFKVAEAVIDHDTAIYEKLEKALNTYVKALAELDGYKEVQGRVNVEEIYYKIQGHYDNLINDLKEDIEEAEGKIALAEEKIAKLEAGFDPQQIAIEAAQVELAKAEAALEAAETGLAAATAAYQQVLDNHDME